MKKLFVLFFSFTLFGCNAQGNPKITYKEYSDEFKADEYPKSILDSYKKDEKLFGLNDREIAIKMNADIILEDLIDAILRYSFQQNSSKLNETNYTEIKSKLSQYYKTQKIDFYTDKIIADRAQQWIADSIVQSRYGGKIYYDFLKRTPKPKEAYQKMILDLLDKNEIVISDEFMKKEILSRINTYTTNQKVFACNFNLIETWNAK